MPEIRRLRPLLGTFVEVGARGPRAQLESAVAAAYAAIEEIHALASFQEADSALSRLNRHPGECQSVPPLLALMLRLALGMGRQSGGLFDCTVGGQLVAAGVLPDHGGARALPRGRPEDVLVQGRVVCLRQPLRLTLDGLAKGFAVDRAIAALRARGMAAGWVNAGGDLRVFGDMQLPLQRREPEGRVRELGLLREAAVASSLVQAQPQARFPGWIVGEGGPAPGVWTVLARKAWRADALTKVAALAPPERREALIARLGGRLLQPPV